MKFLISTNQHKQPMEIKDVVEVLSTFKVTHEDKEYHIQMILHQKDISNYQGQTLTHLFQFHDAVPIQKERRKSGTFQKRNSVDLEKNPIVREEPQPLPNEHKRRSGAKFFCPDVKAERRRSFAEGYTYDPNAVTPEISEKLKNGTFAMKVDGEPIYVFKGKLYLRKEIARDAIDHDFPPCPEGWIPAEKSSNTLYWAHWRPLDSTNDKVYEWAWKRSHRQMKDGYYNAIGKNLRGNYYHSDDPAMFVPVGTVEFTIPLEFRTIEGIKNVLGHLDIEGFTFTHQDEIWKITKVAYGLKWAHSEHVIHPSVVAFTLDMNDVDDKFVKSDRKFFTIPREDSIKILQYNTLAPTIIKPESFKWCPSEYLSFEYRKYNLLMEITFYKSDIFCVQEMNHYDTFWKMEMEKFGYSSVFTTSPQSKMAHGCAIFYKKEFETIEVKLIDFNVMKHEDHHLAKNNVAILVHLKRDDKDYLIATTHLYWNPACNYIRFRQLCHLFDEFKKHLDCHIIFAGDLNLAPESVLYNFITGKKLDDVEKSKLIEIQKEPDLDFQERVLKVEKLLKEDFLELTSCYGQLTGEPKHTTVDEMFTGTLDYIFISKNLKCVNVVSVPQAHPIPNEMYSSDHFCIYSEVVHQ